ncbi:MAG: hypothetical protein KJ905_04085 [Nanoarchaeota archaeon]|nr:hypothetical protein [Nanoarchaeota archaeon]MBU1501920.1 hypothetical protein [Nanoarchaeota archaeon]MBU2459341.1 hypothetical protein [Nanoarchaeota archaeon]
MSETIYKILKGRDYRLLNEQIREGLTNTSGKAIQLARDCAYNYDRLKCAGLYDEAEDLRRISFFWSIRYKQATGELKFFEINGRK